jgi:hypothetical protein
MVLAVGADARPNRQGVNGGLGMARFAARNARVT